MSERATKVREPVNVSEAIRLLAESGKAVVRESDGSYSVLGTTSKTDRPRRESVLYARNYEDALREATA